MAAVAKILLTSSKLSASGGLWKRAEAQLLTATAWTSTGYWLSLGTTAKTINATFATNSNQQGIVLCVRNASFSSLTIKLYEGANLRTTDTFDLAGTPITVGSGANGWHYFPLTSYAVTTAAATWSYQLFVSGSTSPAVLVTTSAGTDINYAVICDADTTVPASGDTTILADNVVLSIDQSVTHGVTGTGGTMAVVECLGSTYQCLNADLSAPITIAMNGTFFPSYAPNNSSHLLIGTSADPITVAHLVTLDMTGDALNILILGTSSTTYVLGTTQFNVEFYGVEDSYLGARVAADAAANQKNVVLTTDLSAQWQANDALCLIGKSDPNATDTTNNTVGSISGITLTLGTNLDHILLKGAAIVNGTRAANCGIYIKGTSATQTLFSAGSTFDYIHMVGVRLAVSLDAVNYMVMRNNTKNVLIRNVIVDAGNTTLTNIILLSGCNNAVVNGIYDYYSYTTYQNGIFFAIAGNNMNISNVFEKNRYYATSAAYVSTSFSPVSVVGNGNTVSGLVAASARYSTSAYSKMYLYGAANTISDIFVYAPLQHCLVTSLINSSIGGLILNGASNSDADNVFCYNLVNVNSIGLTLNSPFIGVDTKGKTGEIFNWSDTLNQLVINSPTFNASPTSVVDNTSNCLPGSYVRFQNYNVVTDDCRGYETYGKYVSTKAGFTDSTVHTAGGLALRREPTSSTNQDTWVQTFPTGNIQNKSMTVIVWCNINSADYYGGAVYQLPRLTINYDNGTIAYVQASQSTGWQRMAVTFTPLTTYGQITATLSTMTDATGSNAYVYWDDYDFQLPSGVQLNLGLMDDWANGLPIMPSIATNITAKGVADAVWDDKPSEHNVASSFGKTIKLIKNSVV